LYSNTVATVNSTPELVLSSTQQRAGTQRQFGVDGNIQAGTGYLTGFANRNVFTIDYVSAPAQMDTVEFGIKFANLPFNSSSSYFAFAQSPGITQTRYDLDLIYSDSGFGTTINILSNVPQSNLYARFQLQFFNPVFNYVNALNQSIDFDWAAFQDGVNIADSTSNNKLRLKFNQFDLCNNTYYFIEGRAFNSGTNVTFDNFGIGLNGNLSCIPSAIPTPPPAPGP